MCVCVCSFCDVYLMMNGSVYMCVALTSVAGNLCWLLSVSKGFDSGICAYTFVGMFDSVAF